MSCAHWNGLFNLVSPFSPETGLLLCRPLMSWCSFTVFNWSQEECTGDRHDWFSDHFPPGGRAPRVCQAGLWGRAGRCAAGGDSGPGISRSNTEVRRGSRYHNEPIWNKNLHSFLAVYQDVCWQSLKGPFSLFSVPRRCNLIQYQWVKGREKGALFLLVASNYTYLFLSVQQNLSTWRHSGVLAVQFVLSLQLSTSSDILVFEGVEISDCLWHPFTWFKFLCLVRDMTQLRCVLAASHWVTCADLCKSCS